MKKNPKTRSLSSPGESERATVRLHSTHRRPSSTPHPSPAKLVPAIGAAGINPPLEPKCHFSCGATILSEQTWNQLARCLDFSGRELQIVHEIFDDQTEFAIAEKLGISSHTIHTHCERLYHKLGVTDRVKLVLRIMREFFVLTTAPGSSLPPICADYAAGRCPLQRN